MTGAAIRPVMGGWIDQAACKGCDPALFFPERGEYIGPAMSVCRRCPVKRDALESPLTGPWGRVGIWAAPVSANGADCDAKGSAMPVRDLVKQAKARLEASGIEPVRCCKHVFTGAHATLCLAHPEDGLFCAADYRDHLHGVHDMPRRVVCGAAEAAPEPLSHVRSRGCSGRHRLRE